MNQSSEARRIIIASAGAALVAAVLLATVILPSEYGWDPLGTGEALGLMGLAGKDHTPLHSQGTAPHSDSIAFALAPYESVEYKYRLETGATMVFEWRASEEVLVDMHAEPDGAAPGYAETFNKTRTTRGNGSYRAAFGGIHGWYWQNRTQEDVIVTLKSQGFFSESVEMGNGRSNTRQFAEQKAEQN
ncbi:MAG: hypothetical protein ACI9JM_000525 [Halioglobus sp.]|jgi:hypothetical protein